MSVSVSQLRIQLASFVEGIAQPLWVDRSGLQGFEPTHAAVIGLNVEGLDKFPLRLTWQEKANMEST